MKSETELKVDAFIFDQLQFKKNHEFLVWFNLENTIITLIFFDKNSFQDLDQNQNS